MKRIALNVSYLGTNYFGWQKQPGLTTLQETLEKAVEKIAQHEVSISASGRTDKGVHALNQVVHFDTDTSRDIYAWINGVNRFLPQDIVVTDAREVPFEFHARYSAVKRFYRYVLLNQKIRQVILNKRVGWFYHSIDVKKMNEAAQCLKGEHDFSAFRSSQCQAFSPIKKMNLANVYQQNELIFFDFEADGFLHNMIRIIVAALIDVGCHKKTIVDFKDLLNSKDRTKAPSIFMPDGLYLTQIVYPKKFQINFSVIPNWFWGRRIDE